MPSGYSGTPLLRKLGIAPGMACAALDAPDGYPELLGGLPKGVDLAATAEGAAPLDFVHVFARERQGLEERLRELRTRITPNGMIWVSWPKKASGVETDLSGNVVRAAGLAAGLVDVKVCAVDETWSGLKFVIPTADRG